MKLNFNIPAMSEYIWNVVVTEIYWHVFVCKYATKTVGVNRGLIFKQIYTGNTKSEAAFADTAEPRALNR